MLVDFGQQSDLQFCDYLVLDRAQMVFKRPCFSGVIDQFKYIIFLVIIKISIHVNK